MTVKAIMPRHALVAVWPMPVLLGSSSVLHESLKGTA